MTIRRSITASRVLVLATLTMGATLTAGDAAETARENKSATLMVDGKPIPMSAADRAKLQKLQREHITVLYPTIVPKRFSLKEITLSDEVRPAGLEYSIVFGSGPKHNFSIESGREGT